MGAITNRTKSKNLLMDSFEDYLLSNRDKKIHIITPGGNHGDTLIHMGLVKKLQEYNIQYSCFNLETQYRKNPVLAAKYLFNIGVWKLGRGNQFRLIDIPKDTELIIFEGGGYMNDVWFGPVLLKQIMNYYQTPVAIGPQSFLFTRTIFKDYFKDNRPVYLFCRERYSQKHLREQKLPENVSISLSPELSLYLTRDDLAPFIEPRNKCYALIAFRKDRESMVGKNVIDKVLAMSSAPLVADISMQKSFTDFVSTVEFAEEIYTDRLHIAILAKILGIKVTLFGNQYHKNRGVWEYSLKENVVFVED
jgi:exopolysaccharide biosynthesis predicted pyruvyltransferase EpsI